MRTKLVMLMVVLLGVLSSREAQAFYNPSTGRWLSRDPIGENGGNNISAFNRNVGPNGWDVLGLDGVALPADVKIPDHLKPCCDDKTVAEGERKLRQTFNKLVDELKKMKASPAAPGDQNNNFSCKNSSRDILSFMTPGPKCWNCRVELRKDATKPGDHQVVMCKSYGISPKEIMFDWWGEMFKLNYGGDPAKFRKDYPVLIESPPNPYFTSCEDDPFNPPGGPPPKGCWGACLNQR